MLQMQAGALCDQLWPLLQELPSQRQEGQGLWGELIELAQQAPSQTGRKLIKLLAQNACSPARLWAEGARKLASATLGLFL